MDNPSAPRAISCSDDSFGQTFSPLRISLLSSLHGRQTSVDVVSFVGDNEAFLCTSSHLEYGPSRHDAFSWLIRHIESKAFGRVPTRFANHPHDRPFAAAPDHEMVSVVARVLGSDFLRVLG